ncbi:MULTISPECIES: hypothetical protein [Methanoculleus]|uniref:Uncharacterized protein n=1 Tax=Methanoculleus submarinus TaxID=204050 RepID=A0AAX3E8M6_9EURY|nr:MULTISPECIES: hypothetical protein [Methanoculleus]UYU18457.1 hypothetical protein OH143_12270 [Methanoculleus submarinus]
MLFSDRLEIWNPGTLPPSLSKNSGRLTGRLPANPLLTEPMMAREAIELYIEGMLARGEEIPTEEGLLEYTLTVEAHA